MMDADESMRMDNNRKKKRLIGFLLFLFLGYVVYSNFDPGWPVVGFLVKDSSVERVDVCGPKMLTETYNEQLKVRETGFKVMSNERKAVLEVENIDDVEGTVRVILYCVDGAEQGVLVKDIVPGQTEAFNFLDVVDCDLDYYISPEIVSRKRNRSISTQADCPD